MGLYPNCRSIPCLLRSGTMGPLNSGSPGLYCIPLGLTTPRLCFSSTPQHIKSAMEKTFHFVNGISPDEASKRLSRRHVMKGKNAGKKIHRRSRMDLQFTQSPPKIVNNPSHLSEDINQTCHRANWRYASPSRLSIDFGNAFLTFSLSCSPPVEVTTYSLDIINECEDEPTRFSTEFLLTTVKSLSIHPTGFIQLSSVSHYTMLNPRGWEFYLRARPVSLQMLT